MKRIRNHFLFVLRNSIFCLLKHFLYPPARHKIESSFNTQVSNLKTTTTWVVWDFLFKGILLPLCPLHYLLMVSFKWKRNCSTQKYHVARYYLGFQTSDIHFSTQIIIQLGGVTFYFEMIQILLDLCLLFPNRDGLSHVLAQNFILVMVSFITYCYFIRPI